MLFTPETRILHLDRKDCVACHHRGDESTPYPCPTDGNGPRGGARGCRTCYGSGRHYDHENRRPCSRCGGEFERHDTEDFTDNAPREAIDALIPTLRVVRQNRAGTWNEAYLGMGSLWSSTDYGRAWEQADEAVLTDVAGKLAKDRTQACKIVRPYDRADVDATLVDELVIVLHRDGYVVVAH